MPNNEKTQDESQPKIKRGRFDSLNLYEVTEAELKLIERGSPSSLFLNFAIFCLSVAISFTIAVVNTKIDSPYKLAVFVAIMLVGYLGGVVLGVLWFRNRSEFTIVIDTIKKRMKAEDTSVMQVQMVELSARASTASSATERECKGK